MFRHCKIILSTLHFVTSTVNWYSLLHFIPMLKDCSIVLNNSHHHNWCGDAARAHALPTLSVLSSPGQLLPSLPNFPLSFSTFSTMFPKPDLLHTSQLVILCCQQALRIRRRHCPLKHFNQLSIFLFAFPVSATQSSTDLTHVLQMVTFVFVSIAADLQIMSRSLNAGTAFPIRMLDSFAVSIQSAFFLLQVIFLLKLSISFLIMLFEHMEHPFKKKLSIKSLCFIFSQSSNDLLEYTQCCFISHLFNFLQVLSLIFSYYLLVFCQHRFLPLSEFKRDGCQLEKAFQIGTASHRVPPSFPRVPSRIHWPNGNSNTKAYSGGVTQSVSAKSFSCFLNDTDQ